MAPASPHLALADRRDLARRRLASLGLSGDDRAPGPPSDLRSDRLSEPPADPLSQPLSEPPAGPPEASPAGPGAYASVDAVATRVADVVGRHLALQAQDLPGGLWSLGVRTGLTQEQVLQAWRGRAVTRTWPMRGTLHLVASRDLAWLTGLLAGRTLTGSRARYAELGLDDEVVARGRRVLAAALAPRGTSGLSRSAAYGALDAGGIDPTGQRGVVLLARLCMEGLLCQGAPEGTEPTFVLLEAWEPDPWRPGREEAMATVAERYVRSHGPVTERDLAGWTGQSLGFAREAVALAGDRLGLQVVGGSPYLVHADAPEPAPADRVLLLPGFDEYLLGYKDRSAMLTRAQEALVVPGGNGMFLATVVIGGLVAGTWGRRTTPTRAHLTVRPWRTLPRVTVRRVERAAAAYGRFLERPVTVSWTTPPADPPDPPGTGR